MLRKPAFPFLLLLSAAIHGAPLSLDSSKYSFEAGLRMGDAGGSVVDQDNKLYDDVGFDLVDSKGNASSIDAVGTEVGLDLGAYARLSRFLTGGLGFVYQYTSTSPSEVTSNDSKFEAELMTEEAFLLRARIHPWAVWRLRFGFELGAGPSFATLHRFGLAEKNISVITEGTVSNGGSSASAANVQSYVDEGNKPLDLSGYRLEFALECDQYLARHFGVNLRLGAHLSEWSVSGSDPLRYWTPKYPSSLSAYGFDITVGIAGLI